MRDRTFEARRDQLDANRASESLKKIKAEDITLTLTLGQIDALVNAGHFALNDPQLLTWNEAHDLKTALQQLDAAVNL